MKFESGNSFGKNGRLRGSRNRLTAQVFDDILAHWNEPIEGRNVTKGVAALEVMRKEKPSEYVKVVTSLLPKELVLSDTTLADATEEQIDAAITALLRQQAERATEAPN